MKLSKNFTLAELTYSETAQRLGIDNTPSEAAIARLRALCEKVLQPIRDRWGAPIIVSSGYRCDRLNALVGGSKTSQHRLGQAADLHALDRADNHRLWLLIRDMANRGEIVTGQVIREYGTYDNPRWLHVSTPGSRTNQFLTLGAKK